MLNIIEHPHYIELDHYENIIDSIFNSDNSLQMLCDWFLLPDMLGVYAMNNNCNLTWTKENKNIEDAYISTASKYAFVFTIPDNIFEQNDAFLYVTLTDGNKQMTFVIVPLEVNKNLQIKRTNDLISNSFFSYCKSIFFPPKPFALEEHLKMILKNHDIKECQSVHALLPQHNILPTKKLAQ